MSKDSAHFKNEQRKQAQVEERVAAMRAKAARISAAELAAHQRCAGSGFWGARQRAKALAMVWAQALGTASDTHAQAALSILTAFPCCCRHRHCCR